MLKYPLPALGLGLALFFSFVNHLAAQPLTQAQLIQLALEHNPRIRAAQKTWEAARARIWPARMLPDPELSFEYEALPEAPSLSRFGERSIGVAQTLEFPARPYLRGQIAAQEAQVAELEYEAVRTEVAAEVAQACGRLWAGQRRLGYAEESLRLATEFRDRTLVRVDAGDAARAELLRAVVEAGRAEVGKATAQQQLRQARAVLNTLLNQDLSIPIELSENLNYTPVAFDLQDLQQQALVHRPDLQGFRAHLKGTVGTQRLATYALVPDLNLGMASQKIRGEGDFWKAGLSLRVPLWAWGKQRGEIASARAGVARAQAEELAARNQVLLEVLGAFLKVEITQHQLQLYRDRVLPSAEEAYRYVRRRYDEGGASYLEVIDAGRTLAEVRTAWVEIQLDYHIGITDLTKAIGGNQRDKKKEETR
ncbi:MAG: TolC family protein [Candidatus Latescibacteria bacterium]|nr:TolC family protein [Candidatus Latescibacterota bacterium]